MRSLTSTTSRRPSGGFTVIEVMIVLAIAGLILLLVFEALPALQRNSRNNQRKQDVQTLLEAISRYELNNGGNLPDASQPLSLNPSAFSYYNVGQPNYIQYVTVPSTDRGNSKGYLCNRNNPPSAAQGIYIIIDQPGDLCAPASNHMPSLDEVWIINHKFCDGEDPSTTNDLQVADYNQIAAVYSIETGGGQQRICQTL